MPAFKFQIFDRSKETIIDRTWEVETDNVLLMRVFKVLCIEGFDAILGADIDSDAIQAHSNLYYINPKSQEFIQVEWNDAVPGMKIVRGPIDLNKGQPQTFDALDYVTRYETEFQKNKEQIRHILEKEGYKLFTMSDRHYYKEKAGGGLQNAFIFATGVAEWEDRDGRQYTRIIRTPHADFIKTRTPKPQ